MAADAQSPLQHVKYMTVLYLPLPLSPFVVEDTTNLPPSPPPSPAAEPFGPLEQGRPRI